IQDTAGDVAVVLLRKCRRGRTPQQQQQNRRSVYQPSHPVLHKQIQTVTSVTPPADGASIRSMSRIERLDSLASLLRGVNGPLAGSRLLERSDKPLHFGPLWRGGRETAEQVLGGGARLRLSAKPRVGERQIEARLVQIWIGRQR